MKFSTIFLASMALHLYNTHQVMAVDLYSGNPCTEGPCPTSITSKVNLIIITESGCPDVQSQINGPINDMITSPGFADILNVRQFSFGNNYFVTNICGGNPIVNQSDPTDSLYYDANIRHCWSNNCIDTPTPQADCFGPPDGTSQDKLGMIVTQNGDREKDFNILQACAQKIIGYDDWQSYWPFLVCTETEFETLDMSVDEVGMDCAEGIPELDSNTLLDCLNDPEQAYPALYNMAINTIDHPGTPTILVNGGASPLSGIWDNATAADVCQAYTGPDVPPACPGLIEEKNKYLPGGFFKGLVDGSISCHEVSSKSSKKGKRNKSDKNNLFFG